MKRYSAFSVYLFSVLICGSCFQKKTAADYIFLITLDTTRADCIDYSLNDNELTPNLAELASDGIRFQNAYALTPITLPSHYSMFYSLPPHILKIYNNGQTNDIPHPSLAQLLRNEGYATGAVISLASVGPKWGLNKGFDEYIANYRKPYLWYKTADEVNQDAIELIKKIGNRKAFFWIHYSDPHEPYFPPFYGGSLTVEINQEKKFSAKSTERAFIDIEFKLRPGKNEIIFITQLSDFLKKEERITIDFISYENFSLTAEVPEKDIEISIPSEWEKIRTENTTGYNSQERVSKIQVFNKTNKNITGRLKCSRRIVPTIASAQFLYKEEIKYMDSRIGKLIEFIKAQGLFEKSVFFIMGDHGEGLGEYHDHVGHIEYLIKTYVQVPLIVCGCGISKKDLRENLASNLNIAPSILDLVNIRKPDFMLGDSLFRKLKKKKLLLETYAPEAGMDSFALIDFPYQLIYYPNRKNHQLEFYDLQKDRLGINNLIEIEQESERKRNLLKLLKYTSEKILAVKENRTELSQKDIDILRSLGYLR